MYNIEKRLMINSGTRKVWMALTHKKALQEWMGFGNVVPIDLQVGGVYYFFDGEAMGKFTEIEERKVLEFTWRKTDWDDAWPDSIVRFELKDMGNSTQVDFRHTNLPTEEIWTEQDLDWDTFFLEPMQEWAETDFGGALYGVLPLRRVRRPTQNTES